VSKGEVSFFRKQFLSDEIAFDNDFDRNQLAKRS